MNNRFTGHGDQQEPADMVMGNNHFEVPNQPLWDGDFNMETTVESGQLPHDPVLVNSMAQGWNGIGAFGNTQQVHPEVQRSAAAPTAAQCSFLPAQPSLPNVDLPIQWTQQHFLGPFENTQQPHPGVPEVDPQQAAQSAPPPALPSQSLPHVPLEPTQEGHAIQSQDHPGGELLLWANRLHSENRRTLSRDQNDRFDGSTNILSAGRQAALVGRREMGVRPTGPFHQGPRHISREVATTAAEMIESRSRAQESEDGELRSLVANIDGHRDACFAARGRTAECLRRGPRRTAASLEPHERLSLMDHGHRWAYAKGISWAMKAMASGLATSIVDSGTVFGFEVGATHQYDLLQTRISSQLRQYCPADLGDRAASSSRAIMASLGNHFMGLYLPQQPQRDVASSPPLDPVRHQHQQTPIQLQLQHDYQPPVRQQQSAAPPQLYLLQEIPTQRQQRRARPAARKPAVAKKPAATRKAPASTSPDDGGAASLPTPQQTDAPQSQQPPTSTPRSSRNRRSSTTSWALTGESCKLSFGDSSMTSYSCTDGIKRCLPWDKVQEIEAQTGTRHFIDHQPPTQAAADETGESSSLGKRKEAPTNQTSPPSKINKNECDAEMNVCASTSFESALALPTAEAQNFSVLTPSPTSNGHLSEGQSDDAAGRQGKAGNQENGGLIDDFALIRQASLGRGLSIYEIERIRELWKIPENRLGVPSCLQFKSLPEKLLLHFLRPSADSPYEEVRVAAAAGGGEKERDLTGRLVHDLKYRKEVVEAWDKAERSRMNVSDAENAAARQEKEARDEAASTRRLAREQRRTEKQKGLLTYEAPQKQAPEGQVLKGQQQAETPAEPWEKPTGEDTLFGSHDEATADDVDFWAEIEAEIDATQDD